MVIKKTYKAAVDARTAVSSALVSHAFSVLHDWRQNIGAGPIPWYTIADAIPDGTPSQVGTSAMHTTTSPRSPYPPLIMDEGGFSARQAGKRRRMSPANSLDSAEQFMGKTVLDAAVIPYEVDAIWSSRDDRPTVKCDTCVTKGELCLTAAIQLACIECHHAKTRCSYSRSRRIRREQLIESGDLPAQRRSKAVKCKRRIQNDLHPSTQTHQQVTAT